MNDPKYKLKEQQPYTWEDIFVIKALNIYI